MLTKEENRVDLAMTRKTFWSYSSNAFHTLQCFSEAQLLSDVRTPCAVGLFFGQIISGEFEHSYLQLSSDKY